MIQADEPITDARQDVLGRARMAEVIATEIRDIDPAHGAVVGILGRWGSGKTSLINLIRVELRNGPAYPILDFNPWLFSGTTELVQSFFAELVAQLRIEPGRLSALAVELEHYGDVVAPLQVLPVVGDWIGLASGAGQVLKKVRGKDQGVDSMRKKVEEKLRDVGSPIVVVIDDVDRLHTSEIREMFKLVRLTASFPNLIYLVAFDRERIERALAEDGLPGRDYLEKIIQVAYNIPAIPEAALSTQLLDAIQGALDDLDYSGPFDAERWPDVLEEVVRPLVGSMRDIRRYAGSLRGTVRNLGGQVELVDVLALEAIRVFLPDVFCFIGMYRVALTTAEDGSDYSSSRDERLKREVDELLKVGGSKGDIVTAAIRRVFPTAERFLEHGWGVGDQSVRWLRQRRVAHPDLLDYYLERVANVGLQAFWSAERAFQVLNNQRALEQHFRSLEPNEWETVIRELEKFEDVFPVEAVETATIVLLNLLPEMPERPRSPLDPFSKRLIVGRVVLRLLRRLPDEQAVEEVVRRLLPRLKTLSNRHILLRLVGHEENAGHRLIFPRASQELERSLRDQILSTPPDQLADEPDLFWLLFWAQKTGDSPEKALELSFNPQFAGALLKTAVGEEASQGFGTRAVRRQKQLNWEILLGLVGSEQNVQELVDLSLKIEDGQQVVEARNLAQDYLNGRRPSRR